MINKQFIVITSIFPPTEAIRKFSKIKDFQLVVVGDRKTPEDWKLDNVIYLSPVDQKNLGYKICDLLPWDHYSRKMIGYLYAMENGAEIIVDTDDDNIPYDAWPSIPLKNDSVKLLSGAKYINIYKFFTSHMVWPRGFPLSRILEHSNIDSTEASALNVGIWQFLADDDPDVDAIYRLTDNTPINFTNNGLFALKKGTVCPFNSQNTIFKKDMFPLLYLPAHVTFRFTDILRGIVAQPIAWNNNRLLGFGGSTVVQRRNPHDYLKDFESEIPVYIHSEETLDTVVNCLSKLNKQSIPEDMVSAYSALKEKNIVQEKEMALLIAWIEDIRRLMK